jgi:hypothetical protein
MGETDKEVFKRLVLEYLFQPTDGCATAKEIEKALDPILWEDLEAVLDDPKNEGKIKLHEQTRKVVLLDAQGIS